jgi:hypothetical protein
VGRLFCPPFSITAFVPRGQECVAHPTRLKTPFSDRSTFTGVTMKPNIAKLFPAILLALLPFPSLAGYCGLPDKQTDTLIAKDEVFISDTELKEKYHWNDVRRLWKWGEKSDVAGLETRGMLLNLSPETTDPKHSVPFLGNDYLGGGLVFGKICIGNLQVDGKAFFSKNGLYLYKTTKITYPSNSPFVHFLWWFAKLKNTIYDVF